VEGCTAVACTQHNATQHSTAQDMTSLFQQRYTVPDILHGDTCAKVPLQCSVLVAVTANDAQVRHNVHYVAQLPQAHVTRARTTVQIGVRMSHTCGTPRAPRQLDLLVVFCACSADEPCPKGKQNCCLWACCCCKPFTSSWCFDTSLCQRLPTPGAWQASA
jgi:hypothetical protein